MSSACGTAPASLDYRKAPRLFDARLGVLENGSERERDLVTTRPVVVGVATGRARVEDRAGDYCQGQRDKCDYQREHRLLLSAANGHDRADAEVRGERVEPFHTMRTVVREVAPTLQGSRLIEEALEPARWREFSEFAARVRRTALARMGVAAPNSTHRSGPVRR